MARRKHDYIAAVRGKTIDRIQIDDSDPNYVEVDLKFKDNTSLSVLITSKMVIERVDLLGWKKGNSRLIKRLDQ